MDGLRFYHGEPKLSKSYNLNFVGDWGGANFHRIFSWLTQEFCDRACPRSSTCIHSLRDGGMDAFDRLREGSADVIIATPARLLKQALSGDGIFKTPMPYLRGLSVLPQRDRMVLAIHPKYGIRSFADLLRQKPPIRLATSTNDGTNFIGHVANVYLEAHGITEAVLKSWGGALVTAHRPEQCTALIENGEADALLQEAIMTPWWRDLIETERLVPLPSESMALQEIEARTGLRPSHLPSGFWNNLHDDLPAADFSDFVVMVRDDMPIEVAYVLTWCLVETRGKLEAQYAHFPPERSPLSYPLVPHDMAKTSVPLHPGASQYFSEAGYL